MLYLNSIVTLIYEISEFDWTVSPSCEGVKLLYHPPKFKVQSSKSIVSLRGHISVAKIYNPPFAFAKIDFEKPVARYVNITIERHIRIALEMAHLKQEEILAA